MKANQLRLGNWVEYKGKFYQTTSIEENNISISLIVFSDDNKFIKPIPLTEEILLKCGFEEYDGESFDLNINDKTYLTFINEDMRFFIVNKNENEMAASKWDIKYLHQLQNLYFTLTNKELEFNSHN